MADFTIKQEKSQYGNYKVWRVRFRGHVVANKMQWYGAIKHVEAYYRKFGFEKSSKLLAEKKEQPS